MLRKIKNTVLSAVLLAVLAACGPAVSPVQAAPPPVDLVIGGEGSVPWSISNVKPGDSGTKMVTLRNNGNAAGILSIWVSDIIDSQSGEVLPTPTDPDEPWQLSEHVLFEPTHSRLATTVSLPATLASFPQSSSGTSRITISPVNPGNTIDLIWEWLLPKTAGNAVQGSSLTFSLHYTLTQLPVAPVNPVPTATVTTTTPTNTEPEFTFIITTPEKQTSMTMNNDGTVAESRTVDDISDNLIISFERDTRIITENNIVPTELKVTFRETMIPDPPPGTVIVGPVYELLFYTEEGASPVQLSKPARLVLNYLMTIVPDYVKTLFIASWDEENGWTQLQPVSGLVTGEGQLGALINHFTLFTILGVIEEDEVTPPVIKPPLPAYFETNGLSLSAKLTESGEDTTIRVHVVNSGEMSGEYLLTLKINGLFMESQLVRLEAGQDKNVSFVVSPFEPGTYTIDVNGLEDVLVVSQGAISDTGISLLRYWPLPAVPILVGAGILIAAAAVFFASNRKRSK